MKDKKNSLSSLKIKKINYDVAVDFSKKEKHLIHKKTYNYFALFDNNKMVSMLAFDIQKNKVKFHSFYTPKEYRKKGYFTLLFDELFNELLKKYDCFFMDCLEDSKEIAKKFNFVLLRKKEFKTFDIYYYYYKKGEINNGY